MKQRPKPIRSLKPDPDPSRAGPFRKVGRSPAEAVARAEEELKKRPLRILDAVRHRKD